MKKFIVLIMLVLPLFVSAQEGVIAIVNQSELANTMPEIAAVENEIAAFWKGYENQYKSMNEEYEKKYSDFLAQQDSLPENIKMLRIQDIQQLQTRIENFQPMAEQEREKKLQELYGPIQEKIMKAIEQVGEENGYLMIINPNVLLYKGKSVVDATDKVKAKLGIK